MKTSISRIVAFLLAITYSTFAFAVDCGAVMESCWRTRVQDDQNCLRDYSGQVQAANDCQARSKAKRDACVKAGGCS
jgi:hypothetical protein